MTRHPDNPVPPEQELACELWRANYHAMFGLGDGSVTWWTLQPIERSTWVRTAELLSGAWLARAEAAQAEVERLRSHLHDMWSRIFPHADPNIAPFVEVQVDPATALPTEDLVLGQASVDRFAVEEMTTMVAQVAATEAKVAAGLAVVSSCEDSIAYLKATPAEWDRVVASFRAALSGGSDQPTEGTGIRHDEFGRLHNYPLGHHAPVTDSSAPDVSGTDGRHNHFTRDIKPRGECPQCDYVNWAYGARSTEGEEGTR